MSRRWLGGRCRFRLSGFTRLVEGQGKRGEGWGRGGLGREGGGRRTLKWTFGWQIGVRNFTAGGARG